MPGPVLAFCAGARCGGLRALRGGLADPAALAAAVAALPDAVLVSSSCVGPCGAGSLAGLSGRDSVTGEAGPMVWLGRTEEPERARALLDWLRAGGPGASPGSGGPGACAGSDDSDGVAAAVPLPLADAVLGVGPPPRTAPSR